MKVGEDHFDVYVGGKAKGRDAQIGQLYKETKGVI